MTSLRGFPRRTLRGDVTLHRIHRAGRRPWWFCAGRQRPLRPGRDGPRGLLPEHRSAGGVGRGVPQAHAGGGGGGAGPGAVLGRPGPRSPARRSDLPPRARARADRDRQRERGLRPEPALRRRRRWRPGSPASATWCATTPRRSSTAWRCSRPRGPDADDAHGPKATTARSRPSSRSGPCASSATGSCPRRSSASRLTSGDTRPASPSDGEEKVPHRYGRTTMLRSIFAAGLGISLLAATASPTLAAEFVGTPSVRYDHGTVGVVARFDAAVKPLARAELFTAPCCIAGSRSSGRSAGTRSDRSAVPPSTATCAEATRPEPRAALATAGHGRSGPPLRASASPSLGARHAPPPGRRALGVGGGAPPRLPPTGG